MSASMTHTRTLQLAWAAVLALVVPAIFWIAEGPISALIVAAWGWATILVFHLGRRRSEVIKIIGNTGDERVRTLHLRALAFAGFVLWAVLTVWWLVSASGGEGNETVGILAATFGISYVAAALFQSRRG